jgi:iron complex outermembrane receptor protein
MRHLFRSAALALIMVSPAAAQAVDQAAKSQAASDQSAPAVEQVVVTARKTAEKLRDIPATISAVTASQLQATGPIVGTGDLLRTIPGVRFNDLEAPNLSEISIRGSGTERATGADSAVGLFVNGAYVGSSTLGGRNFKNIDFFDVDRVEVLEGPQGALYGRNSEFGLVNIVSAKPKFDQSGYADESYTGELGQNRFTAVENYAFNDHWAARVGVEDIAQNSGFFVNPLNGKYYDHTDGYEARGQLRYANGPLDVDLLVDGQDLNLPTFVNPYQVAPGVTTTIPKGFIENHYSVPSDGINATEQSVARIQLMADYKLSWATLTSTSMLTNSLSQQHYGSPIDLNIETQFQQAGEVGVYPLSQVYTTAKDNTLYQDLHLRGTTLGGSLDWFDRRGRAAAA